MKILSFAMLTAAFLTCPVLIHAQDEGPSSPVTTEPVMSLTLSDVILTQHWAMPTLYNPAATGDIDYIRIRGGARLQWLGSRQSPKNFLATGDSPFKVLGKRIGAGVKINSESYDLIRNLSIAAQGSYKLQFKSSTLSIGIQAGYYHSKYKGSEYQLNLNPSKPESGENGGSENVGEGAGGEDSGESGDNGGYDDDDDGFSSSDMLTQDVAGGAFDLAVGLQYTHPKFHVSLAANHLTGTKIKLKKEGESATDLQYIEAKLPIALYFEAGGNIALNNSLFTLQPSIFIGSDFNDIRGVVDLRATYNNRISFGLDYRYNEAAGVMAALILKNFFIGYSWEYDWKHNPHGSTGNHELVLGYQFKMDMGAKSNFRQRSIRIM